jgi:hypothetical protein
MPRAATGSTHCRPFWPILRQRSGIGEDNERREKVQGEEVVRTTRSRSIRNGEGSEREDFKGGVLGRDEVRGERRRKPMRMRIHLLHGGREMDKENRLVGQSGAYTVVPISQMMTSK